MMSDKGQKHLGKASCMVLHNLPLTDASSGMRVLRSSCAILYVAWTLTGLTSRAADVVAGVTFGAVWQCFWPSICSFNALTGS